MPVTGRYESTFAYLNFLQINVYYMALQTNSHVRAQNVYIWYEQVYGNVYMCAAFGLKFYNNKKNACLHWDLNLKN